MNLLIVESPSKAKKIAGFLGQGWEVAASVGHIRDLPKNEIGVTAPEYWPKYVTGERSGPTIARLKKLAQGANTIYLATDPDREGEAIAWHLQQVLGKDKRSTRESLLMKSLPLRLKKHLNLPVRSITDCSWHNKVVGY
ncbi:DNA topoisomerase 1 [Suttonella ornithocola]|uniref:DNA topoisomerase 1 n=2 Tax=Suttonella ornithocola TaxID=279832 RepID=A0A380MY21_9GAMM|nr:DNA topoisomerase 1 [Suttonella ornithocola]